MQPLPRLDNGGREYRGLHDARHTYVRTLEGPWLLYDNQADPLQAHNLVGRPAYAGLVADFDARLSVRLRAVGDAFLSGPEIIRRQGIPLDSAGDIAITPSVLPEPYPRETEC